MHRRSFLLCLLLTAPALAAREPDPDLWLAALRRRNGRAESAERLGVWLQAAAAERENRRVQEVVRELARVQERSGYLGVYGPEERLGQSGRSVGELWGTAELGQGLLRCAEAGIPLADGMARKLGALLISLPPERLHRNPGEQHPAATALMAFLAGAARRSGDSTYRERLRLLAPNVGLPGEKSPYPPALPPFMPGWGRDPHRAAHGLTALSGALALARHEEHPLMEDAVRERWRELAKQPPTAPSAELLAYWVRLTMQLFPRAGDPEREAAFRYAGTHRPDTDEPYSALLRRLLR